LHAIKLVVIKDNYLSFEEIV